MLFHSGDRMAKGPIGAVVSREGVAEETGLEASMLPLLVQFRKDLKTGALLLQSSFIRSVKASAGSTSAANFGD